MKKQHSLLVAGVLSTLLLLFTACERNHEPDLNRVGWAYYPLSLGQFHLYDVYRINYNFAAENDTLTYELKELVADYFINQKKDTVYILQRLQRSNADAPWKTDSTYLVQRTPHWLELTVNNRAVIPLMFPVSEGLTWNSNLRNAARADSFEIMNLGQPYEFENLSYPNTLMVEQADLVNTLVQNDERHEVYAYDIGLVYKYVNYLNYCTRPDQDCYGKEIITSGLYLEMKLKEHGIEPL
ncbi:hypothetical protein D770_02870 [Flammeovirgaceae bacterium 311]|nr:hypothetical protein D770_02870 [Flammeovirgaceae bacterium 311]